MKFYVGIHHPSKAHHVPRAFISVNTIERRMSHFPVNDWILDSGAFTTIAKHGGFPSPPEKYAKVINRFRNCGNLIAAVSQDYMCEPWMLERTGLDITTHQRLTILRYDRLRTIVGEIVMPVLQGYSPKDYANHVSSYGSRLKEKAYVGVGSICKRQGNASFISEVLTAILNVRPDLRLHGFGVKTTSLQVTSVRDRLYSADSMAWSYAARKQGRNGNDINEAILFADRIESQAVQGCFSF